MTATTAEALPAIDPDTLPDDAPPKRGPGRPRKDGSAPGSPRADKRPPRRASTTRGKIREQCALLVGGANMLLNMSPYRDDALTDEEMTLATDALTAEVEANTRILAWLEKAAGISPHVLLIRAAITIAIPRLHRRGLLGKSVPDDIPPHPAEACAEQRALGMVCPVHSDPAAVA